MARLNWERFGIRNVRRYKYIVAIDFGHRQTSAHIIRVNAVGNVRPEPRACSLTMNGESVIPTQFAQSERGIVVGTAAAHMENPYIYFKADPRILNTEKAPFGNGKYTRMELVQKYIKAIVENIEKYNMILKDKKVLYIVGCPSGDVWFSDDNDVEYARILSEACKRDVVVMHESRGALLKIRTEQHIKFERGEGILVFDFGSSTADWTFMYTDEDGVVRMLDATMPLGASKIDEMAMEKVLENAPVRKATANEVSNYVNRKIDMIEKKEVAYTAGRVGAVDNFISVKLNRPELSEDENKAGENISINFLDTITRGTQIAISSAERGTVTGSWESLCEGFMRDASKEIKKTLSGVRIKKIMLTGGASKMYFIRDICRAVFSEVNSADIIIDKEPATSVSKGLAYVGQLDIESQAMADNIKKWISEYMKKNARGKNFESKISANIAIKVADDEFFENVIHNALKYWASPEVPDMSEESCPKHICKIADENGINELKQERTKAKIKEGLAVGIAGYESLIRNHIGEMYKNNYGTRIPDNLNFKVSDKTLRKLIDMINNISITFASEEAVRNLTGLFSGKSMFFNTPRNLDKLNGLCDSRKGLYSNFLFSREERMQASKEIIANELYNKLKDNSIIKKIAEESQRGFEEEIDEVVDSMALYAKKG